MPTAAAAGGVKLYYEEIGRGTPIVFVHEFADDCRGWAPQVKFFARRYRTIAFNARGYPPSDVPEDAARYSQAQAADDIKAVLDHLGVAKAHVVGLSMGGYATLHFGLMYPERALSLTVAGAGYGSGTERTTFHKDTDYLVRQFDAGMAAVAAPRSSLPDGLGDAAGGSHQRPLTGSAARAHRRRDRSAGPRGAAPGRIARGPRPGAHPRRRRQRRGAAARRGGRGVRRPRGERPPLRSTVPPAARARRTVARRCCARPGRAPHGARRVARACRQPALPRRPFVWRAAGLDAGGRRAGAGERAPVAVLPAAPARQARQRAHRAPAAPSRPHPLRPRRDRPLRHPRRARLHPPPDPRPN